MDGAAIFPSMEERAEDRSDLSDSDSDEIAKGAFYAADKV
jgi:hypothetical protein